MDSFNYTSSNGNIPNASNNNKEELIINSAKTENYIQNNEYISDQVIESDTKIQGFGEIEKSYSSLESDTKLSPAMKINLKKSISEPLVRSDKRTYS